MPHSLVYLNGSYLPRRQATLDIEDRGTLFADGVYEVTRYYAGRAFAMDRHLARMKRSLAALKIDAPRVDDLPAISDELIARNDRPNANVYWQITRGSAMRHRAIPAGVTPTVLVMSWPAPPLSQLRSIAVQKLVTTADRRWTRCHIKSLMLLDNVLARQHAAERGADDAIYLRDNVVTESTASNLFMVRDGALWTHPATECILAGVTRGVVIELAQALGLVVHEVAFTRDEIAEADELFLTGTTTHVAGVSHIDEVPLPTCPGPITQRLHEALLSEISRASGG